VWGSAAGEKCWETLSPLMCNLRSFRLTSRCSTWGPHAVEIFRQPALTGPLPPKTNPGKSSLRCPSGPSGVNQVYQVSLKSIRYQPSPSSIVQIPRVLCKSLERRSSPSSVVQVPRVSCKSLECRSIPSSVVQVPSSIVQVPRV
jgi:hypothetical protein